MGLGSYIYKNRIVQQHKNIEPVLCELFNTVKPARVIEIGTSYAGLTLLLRDTLDKIGLNESKLVSFDKIVKFNDINKLNSISNLEIKIENIFEYLKGGTVFKLICDRTKDFIQQPGPTIIFCDGGNKIAEFNCLAEHIKPGDIILAHDYIENKQIFESTFKDKIWNWCEVTEDKILKCCEVYNLKPFMQDKFQNVVWACRIKELL